jgi:hypothetical protein
LTRCTAEGPVTSPRLYNRRDRAKLRIGFGGQFEDLPRGDGGNAIIPDPRNDENLMIAGLHCAFILFDNNAVDWARSHGFTGDSAFAKARQLTTWHYQWLVLHEFLPQIVGQPMVDDIIRNGRRFYQPGMREGYIPVEFQAAAYRFGHSMVRLSYRANLAGDNDDPFFGMVFDPAGEGQRDPVDLRGGSRAPRRFIGWQTFFDFGDGEVKPNKRIDTKIPRRCSSCRSKQSQVTIGRRRCRSATCCASSPGACRPVRPLPRRWAPRHSQPTISLS